VTSEEPKTRGYKDLIVWQKAMLLVRHVYVLTKKFPSDERFGLISQMRRAAVSVPSNIAEGQARHSTGEFILFISHAEGSVAELETQLLIAVDLSYCSEDDSQPVFDLLLELRKMLNGLRRKLQGR
jgi:four helix bundle protein